METTLTESLKGGAMNPILDHTKLYRLPWSLPDNAISWLEPTKKCNLYCEGCYRENDPKGHKTLRQVEEDLAVFKKLRRSDAVSIAGGDPLTHPEIIEIVRMIAEVGDFSCSFNSTVYVDTFQYIPEMIAWAQEHIDIVQVMVFILFREASLAGHDYYVGGQRVD